MKELGLEETGHLPDLIQADRAPIRELELPGLPAIRSGEGALLVAEELGLQELRGKRRTVDLDERAGVAWRGRVNGPRHEILADAALPSHQHRRIGARHLLDDPPNGMRLLAA